MDSLANFIDRVAKLLFACVYLFSLPTFGATFGPEANIPLKAEEIARFGLLSNDGLIFNGDIIFYADVLAKSGVVANRWPGGNLYFEVDPSVVEWQKNAFIQACQAWSANTPVKCIERNGQPNYVRLANHNGEKCLGAWVSCSALGMKGGQQDLFIYQGHWSIQHVIQHELGHAFGLIHEQQRTDRDAFVTILWGNIESGAESQFRTISTAITTDYDFESIMHYNNCSFTVRNCNTSAPTEATATIFPKTCNRDLVGGNTITSLDADGIRAAYLGQLAEIYSKSRRASCGTHNMSPKQTALVCGSNCSQASPISYNKIEDFHVELCTGGFTTDPDNFRQCPPLKTLLSSSHNSATFACGFGSPETKYYWDWSCGCEKQTLDKLCSDLQAPFDQKNLEKLRESTEPRDMATVRYIDQIEGWRKLGFVREETANTVGRLVEKNYLDESFNERLFAVLCDMRILIEVHLYVNKSYTLSHADFLKLLNVAKLGL